MQPLLRHSLASDIQFLQCYSNNQNLNIASPKGTSNRTQINKNNVGVTPCECSKMSCARN